MALKSETLPNKALTGEEVAAIAVNSVRDMLAKDCMFSPQIAYRSVAYSIAITFHLGQPHGQHVVRRYARPGELPEPPLAEVCECGHNKDAHGELGCQGPGCAGCDEYRAEDSIVVALERTQELPNPNVARIHNDLPITMQSVQPPRSSAMDVVPGESLPSNPFPEITNHELRYDKTQYPAPPAPVDKDVSEQMAEKLGVKPRGRMGLAEKAAKERGR